MMKKTLWTICNVLFLTVMMMCVAYATPQVAYAEMSDAAPAITEGSVGEPLTWSYLATIAGAAAFTLLIVQFFKAPLDKVWKIPTRVFAYFIAFAVMLVATAFTGGLTIDNVLLVAANAFLAAMSAYGSYELTFAKLDKQNNV